MNANNTQRRRPLPYFSIIMAAVVFIWGAKTLYDANQMEAQVVDNYIAQEIEKSGTNAAEAKRPEFERMAAEEPKVIAKRDDAQWMLIAGGILVVIVTGFFFLTNALLKNTK